MPEQLIYDVGVNDGADAAFYLSLGHRVVGIEASPVMAEQLRGRFSAEIASGAFTLLDIGIAEAEGEMDFWVSEHSVWSSFHRGIASRDGTSHHKVRVRTRPFRNVIAQYGVPYYCKIDIEGNDRLCLDGLSPDTAPRYISIEMSHAGGGSDLQRMRELGYDRFKIISQVTRAQPTQELTRLGYTLPPELARLARAAVRSTSGIEAVGGWKFAEHSSGAFAEDTPGAWQAFEATFALWEFLRDIDREYDTKGLSEWFDIHGSQSRAP